jgi:hypothetical protein
MDVCRWCPSSTCTVSLAKDTQDAWLFSVMEPMAGAIYPHFGTGMRVCAISEAASRLTKITGIYRGARGAWSESVKSPIDGDTGTAPLQNIST